MTRVTPSLRVTTSRPEIQSARRLVVLLGLLSVVALQIAVVVLPWLLAVAMVGFVVDDQDVLHAHELGHDALHHLPLGFERVQRLAAALEQGATASGEFQPLAQLEGVVVGDDDLGALQIAQHVARNQLAAGVVAVRVVGLEHAQAVADGQAGCDDQETARERLLLGRRTALMVCQAMSMAMTVVLPAPVASFSARRMSSGLASWLALARCSRKALPASRCSGRPR